MFSPCAITLFFLRYRRIYYQVMCDQVVTLKVSRKGLSWSQDINELVDEPYQATCAWGPVEVPSSLQDTVILSTCEQSLISHLVYLFMQNDD